MRQSTTHVGGGLELGFDFSFLADSEKSDKLLELHSGQSLGSKR
jgi:hypothetical protein